jgi:capsular polysaccharide biosynthesis protein
VLRQCGIKPDKYVISGKRVEPFQLATLEALGIPTKKVIISDDNLHVYADRLVIPKLSSGLRPKWVCDFLRQELLVKKHLKPLKGSERIYISRARAIRRKVINEQEVIERLAKHGFRTVLLERMSIEEQVRLFASAKVVIGPHGSGFTNMVFSNPGATMIEFFSWSFVHDCFPRLSSITGHKHYYLIGEETRPPQGRGDIIVNLSDLDKLLKKAGI